MLENYHTHTARCRHAIGTDEEYVRHAIASGLKTLGFSDHTPYRFLGDYYSSFRMFPENLPEYVSSVLSLKEKYADQIRIRLGLEVEYYPDRMDALLDMLAPYEIEYMILGQHYFGNEVGEPYVATSTDSEALLARYCDQVIAGMETGLFSYVAHPDILRFHGEEKIYQKHMTRLCQAAKELHLPLEINFLGLREGRHYPRSLFWEIAGDVGCKVVFGSDAHAPQYVVHPQTEAQARNMVARCQLELLEEIPIHSYR